DVGEGFGDGGGQDFGAGFGDENVVFNADAAHVGEAGKLGAVERAFEIAHFFGSREDARNLVKAGLDGDAHARGKITIEAQIAVARRRFARAPGCVTGKVAQIFHVVHIDAEQVTDAVRKEQ